MLTKFIRFLLVSGSVKLLCSALHAYPSGGKCPLPNICTYGCDFRNRFLFCSGSSLGPYAPELPPDPTSSTWFGDFSGNMITDLQNRSFYSWLDTAVLFHTLNYANNSISRVEKRAFVGLENCLHTLILDSNRLSSLPVQAFSGLKSLQVLSVSRNRLLSLDFICHAHMISLYQLMLSHNELSEISPTCFYATKLGLQPGSILSLSNNKLTNFDVCTLQGRAFEQFSYTDNRLICMCDMSWLTTYSKDTAVSCRPGSGEQTVSLRHFLSKECLEANSTDIYECRGLIVLASVDVVEPERVVVNVSWQIQDFTNQTHTKVLIHSLDIHGSVFLGEYPALDPYQRSLSIQLQLIGRFSSTLLICLEVTEPNGVAAGKGFAGRTQEVRTLKRCRVWVAPLSNTVNQPKSFSVLGPQALQSRSKGVVRAATFSSAVVACWMWIFKGHLD